HLANFDDPDAFTDAVRRFARPLSGDGWARAAEGLGGAAEAGRGEPPVPMRRRVCHAVGRNLRSRRMGYGPPPVEPPLVLAAVALRGGLTSADARLTVVSVAPDFPKECRKC